MIKKIYMENGENFTIDDKTDEDGYRWEATNMPDGAWFILAKHSEVVGIDGSKKMYIKKRINIRKIVREEYIDEPMEVEIQAQKRTMQ